MQWTAKEYLSGYEVYVELGPIQNAGLLYNLISFHFKTKIVKIPMCNELGLEAQEIYNNLC